MKLTITAKQIISHFLFYSGIIASKIKNQGRHNSLIIMYHRILLEDEAKCGVQAGMYVKPDTFRIHLEFLKSSFCVVPLSSLLENKLKDSSPDGKPYCILTFDDGWYDFYQHAYPVLKKYRLPATVFLPTDFIGTDNSFWTDRISYLLYKLNKQEKTKIIAAGSNNKIINKIEHFKGPFEHRLEQTIAKLKKYRLNDIEEIISALATRWNCKDFNPTRQFVNWGEVREMKKSGFVTFGSHTVNHHILTRLTDSEIADELKKSKKRLIDEGVVNKKCIPFCYPNGNCNSKISKMVKDTGYSLAVTTKTGWNNIEPENFYTLNRVGIHQDISSTPAMFGYRIAGL